MVWYDVCVHFWVELMTVERNETLAMCCEEEYGMCFVWVLCCKFMLQYATYCHAYVFGACQWFSSRWKVFSTCCCCFFFNIFSYSTSVRSTEPKGDGNEHFTNNIVLFSSFTWFRYHYYIFLLLFSAYLIRGISFLCVWIYSTIQKLPHDPTTRCMCLSVYEEWVIDRMQIKISYSFCSVLRLFFILDLKLSQLDSHLVATSYNGSHAPKLRPNRRQIPTSKEWERQRVEWNSVS